MDLAGRVAILTGAGAEETGAPARWLSARQASDVSAIDPRGGSETAERSEGRSFMVFGVHAIVLGGPKGTFAAASPEPPWHPGAPGGVAVALSARPARR
jgi:hypothetical protein